jgi:DNA polymerase III subunit delta
VSVPEGLKPVYLLTGSDRPKIESALEGPGTAAVALCNSGSLFGDARLVVVEDVDGRRDADGRLKGGWKAADVQAVAAYLGSPAPGTVLCLVAEDVKKTSPLGKACAKAGEVLEYSVAKRGLQAWVAKEFRDRGVDAEPEACAALIQLVGDDLHALALEVDKLAVWAAGEPLGQREVEALTASTADTPTFELTDAWANRDAARALAASETIFERDAKPRRDTAARLAAALGGHLGRLRALKKLAAEGARPREAAGRLRMHPYYAEKVFSQSEGFSPDELRESAVRLAELDGALKGQSKLAPDLEVQRALVDLTRPPGSSSR